MYLEVDRESKKYIKDDKYDPSWAAQEGQLLIPDPTLIQYPVCDRRVRRWIFLSGECGTTYPH